MQNSFSYERFRTRFETEGQENSEMAYLFEFDVREVVGLIFRLVNFLSRFFNQGIARATSEKAHNTASLEARRGAGR